MIRGFFVMQRSFEDKIQFVGLMPSPLGRVAERSEVGRGVVNYCVFTGIS